MRTAWPDISINVERESIPVEMIHPAQVPDKEWKHIDSKGHGHFWKGEKLPTLEWVVTGKTWIGDAYDGEEIEIGEHRCKLCSEVVEPKRRSEYGPSHIPGLTTITLTINEETFILTPEQYADSVGEWLKSLRKTQR